MLNKEIKMENKLRIGNYIGIGLCIFAWVGLIPFTFQEVGLSLESGIIFSAISIGLLIPIMIYFRERQNTT